MAAASTDSQLGWEARQRPRAAVAAAIAPVFIVGSGLLTAAVFNDAPRAGLLDSLSRAARPGSIGSLPSLLVPYYEYYDDHVAVAVLSSVAHGLGYVALAYALGFLAAIAGARSSTMRRHWAYVAAAGGVIGAVATLLFTIANASEISGFLGGPRTVDRAADVGNSPLSIAAQLMGIPGTQAVGVSSLALGLSWVVICLNSMRVGLLSRFMGVLGIFCGVLFVLPLLSSLPVVQAFWLWALAALLIGRWPNGTPPAWSTGRSEPWPSQSRRRPADEAPAPAPKPAPQAAAATSGREHSSSKKRKKRKKRV